MSAQRWLRSACADAQADLSHRWALMQSCGKCYAPAHFTVCGLEFLALEAIFWCSSVWSWQKLSAKWHFYKSETHSNNYWIFLMHFIHITVVFLKYDKCENWFTLKDRLILAHSFDAILYYACIIAHTVINLRLGANSLDPDQTPRLWRLIWVYTDCQ